MSHIEVALGDVLAFSFGNTELRRLVAGPVGHVAAQCLRLSASTAELTHRSAPLLLRHVPPKDGRLCGNGAEAPCQHTKAGDVNAHLHAVASHGCRIAGEASQRRADRGGAADCACWSAWSRNHFLGFRPVVLLGRPFELH